MPGTASTATTLDTLPNTSGAEPPGAVVAPRAGKKKAPGPVPPKTEAKDAAPCAVCPDPAKYHSERCREFIFCIEQLRCYCDKHFAAASMHRLGTYTTAEVF